MLSRKLIQTLVLFTFLLAAAFVPALAADKQRVVYHVSEEQRVAFALNNMRNHVKGVGGPDNVELVLVVHGPALKAFHDIEANDRVRKMVSGLQGEGVQFNACGNTMRVQEVEVDELVPGFIRVDQGGVVRIAELQQQGFLYIRP